MEGESEWARVFKDRVASINSAEMQNKLQIVLFLASFAPFALLDWAPELP